MIPALATASQAAQAPARERGLLKSACLVSLTFGLFDDAAVAFSDAAGEAGEEAGRHRR